MERFSLLSLKAALILVFLVHFTVAHNVKRHGGAGDGVQPLSKIQIHKTIDATHENASVRAYPVLLGTTGKEYEWVTVNVVSPNPSSDDWLGVFSPAKFNASTCPYTEDYYEPYLCSAPIKYKYANYSNVNYNKTGKTILKFRLINQRADFAFALFSGGLSSPKLVAISNAIVFANPKAPLYPRLALAKNWDEMTVTWTSGYDISEAVPFVEWGLKGEAQVRSPAVMGRSMSPSQSQGTTGMSWHAFMMAVNQQL